MFNKPSISDYYRALLSALEKQIQISPNEKILNKTTEEFLEELLTSEDVLLPIEFDTDRKEIMRLKKEMRIVPTHMRDDFYQSDGDKEWEYESLEIVLPLITNDTLEIIKTLDPSTRTFSWSPESLDWHNDYVSFSVDIKGYGFAHDDTGVSNAVTSQKKHLLDWISWVNKDIQEGHSKIKSELSNFINDRKKKISGDGERLNSLSAKLGITIET
ncbi:MAG: hypothetical protein NTZ13_01785 [Candidatus Parcubacteria bacterium]|nr:hypothetical protein [Candidatus Parcubacteria bacterium]